MEDVVRRILESAETAYPEVVFDPALIQKHLAGGEVAAQPAHFAELALAFACAEGNPAALRVFDARYLSEVKHYVTRVDTRPELADEVAQRLREKLLLGTPPRILQYTGRGPLGGWLRVSSIRLALDLVRDTREVPDDEVAHQVVGLSFDPELELLRERHQAELETALRESLARLQPRERNVLRMHFAEGCTLERIGKCYGVHRSTVLRWIAAAREELLAELTRELGGRLGLDGSEVRSLAGLLRSRIDASLSGLGF
jgi:RNA polymerase sigma-70 factor (ECF subfamily)